MTDSLDAFWGQIGNALDSSDGVCGCALGASANTIDATLAVSRSLAQYAALVAQGTALQKITARKIEVPCAVWTAYANARQDYLIKTQEIFDQLAAKGITIERVLCSSSGVPKLDPGNPARVATARLLAPLRPPAFTGLTKQCPGVVDMAGAQIAGLGWERVPIQLASVPLSAIKGMGVSPNVLTLVGETSVVGFASPTQHQSVESAGILPRAFALAGLQTVSAFTTCFQNRGATPDAGRRCAVPGGTTRSLELLGLLGIGIIAVFMGGVIARAFQRAALAGPEHSNPGDPIFLGDLYWQPRGRARRRRGI